MASVLCWRRSEREKLRNATGVETLGFLQPAEMADVWKSHGAFIISSIFDPWPLAIVEACRAGLPVIHSTACGSAVETVRENFNGMSFSAGNASQLAKALISIHNKYDLLRTMGERSRNLSECYTSVHWASNWTEMARSICVGALDECKSGVIYTRSGLSTAQFSTLTLRGASFLLSLSI